MIFNFSNFLVPPYGNIGVFYLTSDQETLKVHCPSSHLMKG